MLTNTDITMNNDIHVILIPWARVVCLICTPEAQGPQAQGLRVYLSGKPRVDIVLQVDIVLRGQTLFTHAGAYRLQGSESFTVGKIFDSLSVMIVSKVRLDFV